MFVREVFLLTKGGLVELSGRREKIGNRLALFSNAFFHNLYAIRINPK
jgi:hypothetical protein